jgi:cytosine/adenosine deaminase-related metal-dependent hydrolase
MVSPWTLTASWIIPVSGPPLPRGRLVLSGERIVALEPEGARPADEDLGDVAVLPGLVNAHTHLDLTGLAGAVPFTGDFTAWLRAVIRHRLLRTSDEIESDIRAGLQQSIRHGVTLLGDVSAGGQSWDTLAAAPIQAVVFHELLGLTQDRAEQALQRARAWLQTHPATATCRPGLSPHAPYSVRAELFSQAAELRHQSGTGQGDLAVPLAVHLAETQYERELLARRCGPFVGFLRELGVWDPAGLASGVAEVLARCGLAPRRLFIHGNYLTPEDPIPDDSTVVYCPRTWAFFRHQPHPLRDLLARGVRIALGTDSLASNPDLDLLAEARFLHALHPDLPPAAILRLATLSGAEALGFASVTGSLEPGKWADLVVVPLSGEVRNDPCQDVLKSRARVSRGMCRGRWLGVGEPLS